jgi:hypothetical protein
MISQDDIRRPAAVLSGVEVIAVSHIDRVRAAAVAPDGTIFEVGR